MNSATKKFKTVKAYVAACSPEVQERLNKIREIVREISPEADEVISYNIPAYKLGKVLIYFAAYKNHVGFYPGGKGIEEFEEELADYRYSKGAVQFPHDKKLPVALIKKIVKFRVKQLSSPG